MVGRRLAVVRPGPLRSSSDRVAARRAWLQRIRALEAKTFAVYERPSRPASCGSSSTETAFHAAGVAEIYLTLWLLAAPRPSLFTAFLLESVNRVITVVFKNRPLRVGVDEAGTRSSPACWASARRWA